MPGRSVIRPEANGLRRDLIHVPSHFRVANQLTDDRYFVSMSRRMGHGVVAKES